jgi:hypothetical protein
MQGEDFRWLQTRALWFPAVTDQGDSGGTLWWKRGVQVIDKEKKF